MGDLVAIFGLGSSDGAESLQYPSLAPSDRQNLDFIVQEFKVRRWPVTNSSRPLWIRPHSKTMIVADKEILEGSKLHNHYLQLSHGDIEFVFNGSNGFNHLSFYL